MLTIEQQKALKEKRGTMNIEERQVAALEMIADQLAFIDSRLFQIQNKPSSGNPLR